LSTTTQRLSVAIPPAAFPRRKSWLISGVKIAGFLGTILVVPIVWVALFLTFLGPAVLAFAVRGLLGRLSWNGTHRWPSEQLPAGHQMPAGGIIFDRRRDVSKLEGCNTRNVQFRWSVFTIWTAKLLGHRPAPVALDLGAGSLRDTYELSLRGIKVDALDLNAKQLEQSWKAYEWNHVRCEPRLMTGRLSDAALNQDAYDLVLAFDVIEHLPDLEANLARLMRVITPDGLLFVTVPNRRAVFERLFRLYHRRRLKRGIVDTSGVPHVNFKSPLEWEETFRQSGFAVLDHDMAIGFLVNDVWQAMFGIPIRTFVDPVVQKWYERRGRPFRICVIERFLYPRWWMRFVNELDEALKPLTRPLWGWNLMVLSRSQWPEDPFTPASSDAVLKS
jgi:2-polyprenyl-3-methyl-5-hydroxy-6-metoxy-1,4-benzoquinol methylase